MVLVGGHYVAREDVEFDAGRPAGKLLELQRGLAGLDGAQLVGFGKGLLIGQEGGLAVTTAAAELAGGQVLGGSTGARAGRLAGQDLAQEAQRRSGPLVVT